MFLTNNFQDFEDHITYQPSTTSVTHPVCCRALLVQVKSLDYLCIHRKSRICRFQFYVHSA